MEEGLLQTLDVVTKLGIPLVILFLLGFFINSRRRYG